MGDAPSDGRVVDRGCAESPVRPKSMADEEDTHRLTARWAVDRDPTVSESQGNKMDDLDDGKDSRI